MAIQRSVWRREFSIWPRFPCPSCRVGALRINKTSITEEETKASKTLHSAEEWEPDWIDGRFSAKLTCTNPVCHDHIFVCGRTSVSWEMCFDANGDPSADLETYYEPRAFEPSPPVFPVPKQCPNSAKEEIERAFSLLWNDYGSCVNRLRVAIEAMMDEQNIQKKTKIKSGSKKGKFRNLSLHERIEIYAEKEPDAGKQLMALKWVGNVGSHLELQKLTWEDLLVAFEHLEYALELMYVKHTSKLKERANQIIKAKGPIKKTKK